MDVKEEGNSYLLCMACLCVGRTIKIITDDKLRQYYFDTLREIPLCDVPQVVPNVCWECEALLRKVLAFREQVKDSYRILQTYTNEILHECLLSDVSRPPRLKIHKIDPISIKPLANNDSVKSEEDMNDGNILKREEYNVSPLSNKTEEEQLSELCQIPNKQQTKVKRKAGLKKETVSSIPEIEKCEVDQLDSDDSYQDDDIDGIASDNSEEFNVMKIEVDVIDSKDQVKNEFKQEITKITKEKRVKPTKKDDKKILKASKNLYKQKILTIELSYEEMLSERTQTAQSTSFINAQYKCASCLRVFRNPKHLKEHNKSKHAPELGEYICPICYVIESSINTFKAHYKRHTRRFECDVCHTRTTDLNTMYKHLQTRHSIPCGLYTCNICGKLSNSIDTHRYHKDSHKTRVPCKDCDKTFSHRAGLMNHRLAVHESQNQFPCTACDKVFRWKTSLNRHLEKHRGKNPDTVVGKAYCSDCDIGFSSVCSLQRHLRNSLKHVTHDQLKFICDHCQSRFADKTKLRNHIEEKHLHRTYQCHICHKPSKNRVGLEQHIRNVHKGRPNNKICHLCGKGFPTKVQLESHIRSHTGERPFICEYCPTTFSQQSNLYKHHRQVHMNIKSKKYAMCKKRKVERNQTDNPPTVEHGFTVPIVHYMSENIFGV